MRLEGKVAIVTGAASGMVITGDGLAKRHSYMVSSTCHLVEQQ